MPVLNLEGKRREAAAALGFTFLPQQKRITFHKDSWLESPVFCVAGLHAKTPIGIGAYTLINGGNIAHAVIGRYCSIANHVAIGFAEHPIDRFTSSTLTFSNDFQGWRTITTQRGRKAELQIAPFDDRPLTRIGNDVWIGQGAFLKAGITIGDGAIIAAHAVVTSDVEPYAIVAGVPARTLRMRFADEICARLLALRWWDYCMLEFGGIDVANIEQSVDWMEKNLPGLEMLPPHQRTAEDISGEIDSYLANCGSLNPLGE